MIIHVLNQIIERSNEYQINLFLAFIDYEKAFDSLYHNEILSALITQGINLQYLQLIEAVYKDSQATIILDQPGPFFPIQRGVKQGDPLSPILFNCTLEEMFRKLDWQQMGLKVNGCYLYNLRFEDDIILIVTSKEEITRMILDLSKKKQ